MSHYAWSILPLQLVYSTRPKPTIFFAAIAFYTPKIASCTFQNVKVQLIWNVILHFGLVNPEAKNGCRIQLFGAGSNNRFSLAFSRLHWPKPKGYG